MPVRSGTKEELFDSPIKSKEPSENEKPIEGNSAVGKIGYGLEVADFIYGKLLKFLLVIFPLIVIYEWAFQGISPF